MEGEEDEMVQRRGLEELGNRTNLTRIIYIVNHV